MSATVTIIGLAVLAVLFVVYLKLRRGDVLGALMDKRRGSSKLVTRADYVEGREQIPVALSLSADTLYYESPDMEASFELSRIDEVEYTDDLATGRDVHGCRVLRLRSHGATFEFLLDKTDATKWMAVLPPHLYGQP
ncbi:MAG TPA: hypothetical protein VFV49_17705, partial [Thermoanaerobaculia bacterium]|nr:hypothetical protein [Thermoanaerobaculia bacterium]